MNFSFCYNAVIGSYRITNRSHRVFVEPTFWLTRRDTLSRKLWSALSREGWFVQAWSLRRPAPSTSASKLGIRAIGSRPTGTLNYLPLLISGKRKNVTVMLEPSTQSKTQSPKHYFGSLRPPPLPKGSFIPLKGSLRCCDRGCG